MILKGKKLKIRILKPYEYEKLREQANKHRTNLDCCLLLGARYYECVAIQKHPEWLDSNGKFINLPEEKKVLRTSPDRSIRLSNRGEAIIPYFFESVPLPHHSVWGVDLKLWAKKAGIGSTGICPRTLRKTWESWLITYYPQHQAHIFLSQGHTKITALKHYLNMPFVEDDIRRMKKWVEGWI